VLRWLPPLNSTAQQAEPPQSLSKLLSSRLTSSGELQPFTPACTQPSLMHLLSFSKQAVEQVASEVAHTKLMILSNNTYQCLFQSPDQHSTCCKAGKRFFPVKQSWQPKKRPCQNPYPLVAQQPAYKQLTGTSCACTLSITTCAMCRLGTRMPAANKHPTSPTMQSTHLNLM
jgi:hypothetical protein